MIYDSIIVTGSAQVSGSLSVTGGITGSFQGTATTASYVLNAVSASFATTAVTASFANAFTVAGTLTAQTLVVQTITSSVDFVTGSTRFGSLLANTHAFTGSVGMTGSLTLNNIAIPTSASLASTYLPLTGGTLTGALGGTSATFIVNQNSTITNSFQNTNTTNTNSRSILNVTAGNVTLQLQAINSDNIYLSPTTAVNTYLGYNNSLNLASTGTATFSSLVQSNANFISNITTDTASVGTTAENNATYNYAGYSGYWGLRTTTTGNNFALDTYNGGTPKNVLTVTQGGNVGIGTTSPTTKLTIDNSVNANTNHIDLIGNSSAGAKGHLGSFGGGTYLTSNYYYASGQNNDTGSLGQGAIIIGTSVTAGSSSISFALSDPGATSPSSKAIILSNGNVGIGTATINSSTNYKMLRLNGTNGGEFVISANETDRGYIYASSGDFNILSLGAVPLILGANGTERMRITSGGKVGIGQNSPNYSLTVNGSIQAGYILLGDIANSNNSTIEFVTAPNSTSYFGGAGNINYYGAGNLTLCYGGGDVAIGHSGASGQRLRVQGASTGSSDYGLVVANSSTASTMLVRNDGYGFLLASSWAYGSDRRMKENISDVENGVDMVLKMKPKHFDYINGQKDNLGFIAQDVQEIIPQAVSISDEKTGMLALKTDFLVPYLVKAVQELSAQIKDLQTEIQTLKNK